MVTITFMGITEVMVETTMQVTVASFHVDNSTISMTEGSWTKVSMNKEIHQI